MELEGDQEVTRVLLAVDGLQHSDDPAGSQALGAYARIDEFANPITMDPRIGSAFGEVGDRF